MTVHHHFATLARAQAIAPPPLRVLLRLLLLRLRLPMSCGTSDVPAAANCLQMLHAPSIWLSRQWRLRRQALGAPPFPCTLGRRLAARLPWPWRSSVCVPPHHVSCATSQSPAMPAVMPAAVLMKSHLGLQPPPALPTQDPGEGRHLRARPCSALCSLTHEQDMASATSTQQRRLRLPIAADSLDSSPALGDGRACKADAATISASTLEGRPQTVTRGFASCTHNSTIARTTARIELVYSWL
jgi:hypothetical protein